MQDFYNEILPGQILQTISLYVCLQAASISEGLVWLNMANFSPAFSPTLNGKEMD
jgi:hypothetical protein